MKLVICLTLFLAASGCEAALCRTLTDDGKAAFMFKTSSTGRLMVTKTLSGTVALLPLCPEQPVKIVQKISYEEIVLKNPVNDCERSAINACEPSFGGLPICNTNNFQNFCGFCLLTTKDEVTDTVVTKRYINGLIYDGSKSVANGTAIACPQPGLLE